LIRVDENAKTWSAGSISNPFSAQNVITTTYGYDALDDLTGTTQTDPSTYSSSVTQSRTFT